MTSTFQNTTKFCFDLSTPRYVLNYIIWILGLFLNINEREVANLIV